MSDKIGPKVFKVGDHVDVIDSDGRIIREDVTIIEVAVNPNEFLYFGDERDWVYWFNSSDKIKSYRYHNQLICNRKWNRDNKLKEIING